jgi:hypothetical protein
LSDSAEAQPILVAPILNFISILVHDVIWERAGGHHGACYIRLKDFESDIMLIVCPRLVLERTMLGFFCAVGGPSESIKFRHYLPKPAIMHRLCLSRFI